MKKMIKNIFCIGLLSITAGPTFASEVPTDIADRMMTCDLTGRSNVNELFPEHAAEVLAKAAISSGELEKRSISGVEGSSCSMEEGILNCNVSLSENEITGFEIDLESYARGTFWEGKAYYEKTVIKRFLGFGYKYVDVERTDSDLTCDLSSAVATENYENWLATQEE